MFKASVNSNLMKKSKREKQKISQSSNLEDAVSESDQSASGDSEMAEVNFQADPIAQYSQ